MRYTAKFFKEGLPEWKRKKDPLLSRIFYRPVSFYISSFSANHGISANDVSCISIAVAIAACFFMACSNYALRIVGALLVNVWLLLDCADGNLARCVKKQPFGEFVDSASSYILVGLLCTMIGVAVYHDGGVLLQKDCPWVILAGALASSSDSLMRLIYQKYKNCERDMEDRGILQREYEVRTDINQVGSLRVRLEADFGVGGILPFLILVGTIFHLLDLVLLYCILYYGAAAVVSIMKYMCKAMKKANSTEETLK